MTIADLRLYRRMRGIFWGLLVIGLLGVPLLLTAGFGIAANLDAVAADVREEIGTPEALVGVGVGFGGFLSLIAAVVLGATAGSVDHQRGVLRDLVLAGKPRWRIVLGRLAAAAAWLYLFMAITFAVSIAVGLAIAPVEQVLPWETMWRNIALFAHNALYTLPFAAGVALLVGSRGPAIAVFFVVAFVVDGVLGAIPKVGEWWSEVSLLQASSTVDALIEDGGSVGGEEWRSIAVVAGWALVPLAAGILRLTRRDL